MTQQSKQVLEVYKKKEGVKGEWWFVNYAVKEDVKRYHIDVEAIITYCNAPLLPRKSDDFIYGIATYHKKELIAETFKRLLTLFPEGLTIFLDCDRSSSGECAWEIKNNKLYLYKKYIFSFDVQDEYSYNPKFSWFGLYLSKDSFFRMVQVLLGDLSLPPYFFFAVNRDRQLADCLLRLLDDKKINHNIAEMDSGSLIPNFIDPFISCSHDAVGLDVWINTDNPLHEKFCALFPGTLDVYKKKDGVKGESWFVNYAVKEDVKRKHIDVETIVTYCNAPLLPRSPDDFLYSIETDSEKELIAKTFKQLLTLFPEGLTIYLSCDRGSSGECAWEIKNNKLYLYKECIFSFDVQDEYRYNPKFNWVGLYLSKDSFFRMVQVILGRGSLPDFFFIANRDRQLADCLLRLLDDEKTNHNIAEMDSGSLIPNFIDPFISCSHDAVGLDVWINPDNPLHEKFRALFPVIEIS